MTRRDPPKLATGSMADIAFLLLVFWLMTTTLETDIGILQLLPASEESPPEPIDPINILEVYANLNNELMVENEIIEIKDLKNIASSFLTNTGVLSKKIGIENYTKRRPLNKELILQRIAEIKSRSVAASNDTLKLWEAKLNAVNFFGEYRELKPSALISIQNDKATSYDLYIQVQNELAAALNELRDDLSIQFFEKPYKELDALEEHDKIMAIRQVYPQRISEADVVDKR